MRYLLTILLLALMALAAGAQARGEFKGKLDSRLTPGNASSPVPFKAATATDLARLPRRPARGSRTYAGHFDLYIRNPLLSAVFIEPRAGRPYIYVDLNRDRRFSSRERFDFSPAKEEGGELLLEVPIDLGRFRAYPLRISYLKPGTLEESEGERVLLRSSEAYASGTVWIAGRPTAVRYEFSKSAGKITPERGWQGIDSDGNGKVDSSRLSPEVGYARGERLVFRVGERYVATRSINAKTGEIILEERPASEYVRIELCLGVEAPDFTFVDFAGATRRLSEFRGKIVLLDFWGTWCGPCVAELPHLKEVYEKYRDRGFEILGMDMDDDWEAVKAFVRDKGVTWPQATTASIQDLIERRFHIIAFPTYILLDRQGRILSLGEPGQLPLHGKKLAETLDQLLAESASPSTTNP